MLVDISLYFLSHRRQAYDNDFLKRSGVTHIFLIVTDAIKVIFTLILLP